VNSSGSDPDYFWFPSRQNYFR